MYGQSLDVVNFNKGRQVRSMYRQSLDVANFNIWLKISDVPSYIWSISGRIFEQTILKYVPSKKCFWQIWKQSFRKFDNLPIELSRMESWNAVSLRRDELVRKDTMRVLLGSLKRPFWSTKLGKTWTLIYPPSIGQAKRH